MWDYTWWGWVEGYTGGAYHTEGGAVCGTIHGGVGLRDIQGEHTTHKVEQCVDYTWWGWVEGYTGGAYIHCFRLVLAVENRKTALSV